jgi:hypothetical protein
MFEGPEANLAADCYVFGSEGRHVYELKVSQVWAARGEVEIIVKTVLERMGVVIPPDYTYYVVMCHYDMGAGVWIHSDDDYISDCKWVVSITAWGNAVFSIREPGGQWQKFNAFPGELFVFDRSLLHEASPAMSTDRVNITVRFIPKVRKGSAFVLPKWYTAPKKEDEQRL